MKKTLKTTLIASAVALSVSGSALAAPPTGYNVGTNVANANPGTFDNWTSATGTISISDLDTVTAGTQICPAGWTCATAMSAAGFYQRQLKDGSGNRYFQTIVADTAGTGGPSALDFADESYIKIGASGLADKQHIADSQSVTVGIEKTTDVFVTDVTASSGWAGAASMSVSQSLTTTFEPNTGNPGIDYVAAYDSFLLECEGASCATGKKINVVQAVMTEAQIDGADYTDNANDDMEKFVFSRVSGSFSTDAHVLGAPVLLPSAVVGSNFNTASPTDIAWAVGDDVSVMWLGQQFGATGGSTDFGYMTYATWSGAETQSAYISSFTNESTGIPFGASTFEWFDAGGGSPFGTAPTMTMGP